ncbi:Crp/Fnr family transcriptional regulator [Flectobacillus major]|jgi:CRP-like cAMP-binding protein|uniref:Crp/Fnr family transcriptional regulator n=1 Tax=Flectobacillus major TaxID=103 RepID=UPI00041146CF|nr:cyclic nucleotide-binding domain-containing protein [Flectobacillus major]
MKPSMINFVKSFVNFTPEEIEAAHCLFEERTIKKGEYFIKAGEYNAAIGFINKGLTRSFFVQNNQETTFQISFENQFVTSMTCYVLNQPSNDYIQAIEDTDLCVISKETLENLCNQYHNWDKFGRLTYQQVALEQEIRLRSFISETAQERYERISKEQPALINRVPQLYLSNFLGITPQSLSRLRRNIRG